MPKLVKNTKTGQVFEVADNVVLPDYFEELIQHEATESKQKQKSTKRKE